MTKKTTKIARGGRGRCHRRRLGRPRVRWNGILTQSSTTTNKDRRRRRRRGDDDVDDDDDDYDDDDGNSPMIADLEKGWAKERRRGLRTARIVTRHRR